MKLLVFWIYLDAGGGKYLDPLQGWSYHADPLPALDTYTRHTGESPVGRDESWSRSLSLTVSHRKLVRSTSMQFWVLRDFE